MTHSAALCFTKAALSVNTEYLKIWERLQNTNVLTEEFGWDILNLIAEVAELAYALASGASGETIEGSTPSFRTIHLEKNRQFFKGGAYLGYLYSR